jgi:hypothetical protein
MDGLRLFDVALSSGNPNINSLSNGHCRTTAGRAWVSFTGA